MTTAQLARDPNAWIWFDEVPIPTKKTRTWAVIPARTGHGKDLRGVLGHVKWYAPWRRYAFFPAAGTVFEPGCRGQLTRFMDAAMSEYFIQRKSLEGRG